MAASNDKKLLSALEANWQSEMEGFHIYTALSKSEQDPHRRNALRGLAMAVIVAAIVSLVAHFAVGAAKSLITIRSWWASGFEMTWIGALEGVVTYVIGIGLGKLGGG